MPTSGKYRTDLVAFGFAEEMGVDVMFLAKDGDENVVVVAVQYKSGTDDLLDALQTISPGLQFLPNVQRVAIVTRSVSHITRQSERAFLQEASKKRKEFKQFIKSHPELGSDWVRIAAVNRSVDSSKIRQEIDEATDADVPSEILEVNELSPLVLLDFQRETFLTRQARRMFTSKPTLKTSRLPRNKCAYFPVSIDYAKKSLEELKSRYHLQTKVPSSHPTKSDVVEEDSGSYWMRRLVLVLAPLVAFGIMTKQLTSRQ